MDFPGEAPAFFGSEVEEALAAVPENANDFRRLAHLREWLGPERGRRASHLHELRIRSKAKFEAGWLPYLTARGLEQASAQPVARARAERVAAAGGTVWDATAGLGADSVAMADAGVAVIASDRDPETLACARSNLARARGPALAILADARQRPVRAPLLVIDPDRRPHGRRTLDPERWSPRLSEALLLAGTHAGACLKLAPALDPGAAQVPADLQHSWQWVSLRGELAEVALWTGELALDTEPGAAEPAREVLALDGRGGAVRFAAAPAAVAPLAPDQASRTQWLSEPDPALIRSGLLGALALAEGMRPLGPRLAYLAGEGPARSALLRSWRVRETCPLDPRRVRRMLGRHGVGVVTVMKRGHPDPAEALARRLRGPGRERGLLAVARLARGHLALLLDQDRANMADRAGGR